MVDKQRLHARKIEHGEVPTQFELDNGRRMNIWGSGWLYINSKDHDEISLAIMAYQWQNWTLYTYILWKINLYIYRLQLSLNHIRNLYDQYKYSDDIETEEE